MTSKVKKISSNTYSVQLAAHKVPVFVEDTTRGQDFIVYGADMDDYYWYNRYPDYLMQLFNRSAKHGAIVSGKAKYIDGAGFMKQVEGFQEAEMLRLFQWLDTINPSYDADELKKRIALDLEIFGGFYLKVVMKRDKSGIASIYHADWSNYRMKKGMKVFVYCDSWDNNMIANPKLNETYKEYPAFQAGDYENPVQIFCYRQYRPGLKSYPLPEYVSGCADIESSVEISNYDLNNIKNGFWGGKHISYNNGVPEEPVQAEIQRKLKKQYTGTDNANKFLISFSNSKDNAPTFDDITATNSDKVFESTEPRVSEGIFVAHKVTSPMLFGIKTEGQLGGNNEMMEAWTIFQANYVSYRQKEIEKVFNYFAELMTLPQAVKIQPLKYPIIWTEAVLKEVMTPDEIREVAGLSKLAPTVAPAEVPLNPDGTPVKAVLVNENLKNLTAKQHQQLARLLREYSRGKWTEGQIKALLKSSFGLNDADVLSMIGEVNQDSTELMKFYVEKDNRLLELFAQYGIPQERVSLIARRFKFSDEDQEGYFYGANLLSKEEVKVLNILKESPTLKIGEIAAAAGLENSAVVDILQGLKDSSFLKETTKNKSSALVITSKGSDILINSPKTVSIKTMYSYQVRPNMGETLIEGSRDFCRKLISLKRIYSRADIQKISLIEGYDVFEFTGGWYTKKGGVRGEDTTPYCRHKWAKELVYVND